MQKFGIQNTIICLILPLKKLKKMSYNNPNSTIGHNEKTQNKRFDYEKT